MEGQTIVNEELECRRYGFDLFKDATVYPTICLEEGRTPPKKKRPVGGAQDFACAKLGIPTIQLTSTKLEIGRSKIKHIFTLMFITV
jgi:hypothetical protein